MPVFYFLLKYESENNTIFPLLLGLPVYCMHVRPPSVVRDSSHGRNTGDFSLEHVLLMDGVACTHSGHWIPSCGPFFRTQRIDRLPHGQVMAPDSVELDCGEGGLDNGAIDNSYRGYELVFHYDRVNSYWRSCRILTAYDII